MNPVFSLADMNAHASAIRFSISRSSLGWFNCKYDVLKHIMILPYRICYVLNSLVMTINDLLDQNLLEYNYNLFLNMLFGKEADNLFLNMLLDKEAMPEMVRKHVHFLIIFTFMLIVFFYSEFCVILRK